MLFDSENALLPTGPSGGQFERSALKTPAKGMHGARENTTASRSGVFGKASVSRTPFGDLGSKAKNARPALGDISNRAQRGAAADTPAAAKSTCTPALGTAVDTAAPPSTTEWPSPERMVPCAPSKPHCFDEEGDATEAIVRARLREEPNLSFSAFEKPLRADPIMHPPALPDAPTTPSRFLHTPERALERHAHRRLATAYEDASPVDATRIVEQPDQQRSPHPTEHPTEQPTKQALPLSPATSASGLGARAPDDTPDDELDHEIDDESLELDVDFSKLDLVAPTPLVERRPPAEHRQADDTREECCSRSSEGA